MSWILTSTKKKFFPLQPDIEDIDIIDIAHSLSQLCRFNGHCFDFYSVAEHSCLVAEDLADEFKLWGLLHDAGEAYLSDIPRPIKNHLKGFEVFEDHILTKVMEKFDLPLLMPKDVKKADDDTLKMELNHFYYDHPSSKIQCLNPKEAKEKFLKMFYSLYKGNL